MNIIKIVATKTFVRSLKPRFVFRKGKQYEMIMSKIDTDTIKRNEAKNKCYKITSIKKYSGVLE